LALLQTGDIITLVKLGVEHMLQGCTYCYLHSPV